MSNFCHSIFPWFLEALHCSKILLANYCTFLEISHTVNIKEQRVLVLSEDPQTGLQIKYRDDKIDLGKLL